MSVSDDPVFLNGSLMRHVSVMSFTASIGLMAMFAVDFVDMIFISMLGNGPRGRLQDWRPHTYG